MANILKPNSARIALRAIPRQFAAAAASATPASIASRFSSVRCICCSNSRHRYDHKPVYYWRPPINFGIHFVPEQTVYIVERFGKYFKTLPTGVHFLTPFADEVVRVHKIWIETLKFHHDFLLTKDQHTLSIDAWVDFKIVDPKLASYVAQISPLSAVHELAEISICSEIRKITLENFNNEKENILPKNVVDSINVRAKRWGIECVGCWIDNSCKIVAGFR